jgi:hypothetical protein
VFGEKPGKVVAGVSGEDEGHTMQYGHEGGLGEKDV